MLVFGVVFEKKAPYKEVICFAEVRDENNERMSKTKPNYVKFDDAADKMGSDILRWNYASASIGGNMRFGWPTLEDVRRRFYIQLWNSYNYFVTYAQLHNWDSDKYNVEKLDHLMDRWMVAKTKDLVFKVNECMDQYNMPTASRDIEEYAKDLSQWYIRRSRNRFKNGDSDAIGTLHHALVTLSKLLAPFLPFISEEIYQNLVVNMGVDSKESVHLDDFPTAQAEDIDEKILADMQKVRDIASNGLKIREDAKLNLRQPLCKAFVNIESEELREIVKEEINVKEISYSEKPEVGEGINTTGEGANFITIDCNLTTELRNEALVNEFMRRYKDLRKKKGLKVDDMVTLSLKVEDDDTRKILEDYVNISLDEFHAKEVLFNDSLESEMEIELNEQKIGVTIN